MVRNKRRVEATPDAVWKVLSDGWLYPLWVVGASRIRQVEDEWPQPGSRIHHSVGVWPGLVDDSTQVIDASPGSWITLQARAWPFGEAGVTVRVEPLPDGCAEVSIEEDVSRGPARLIPQPLLAPGLKWRNSETLRRLAYLAEGRG